MRLATCARRIIELPALCSSTLSVAGATASTLIRATTWPAMTTRSNAPAPPALTRYLAQVTPQWASQLARHARWAISAMIPRCLLKPVPLAPTKVALVRAPVRTAHLVSTHSSVKVNATFRPVAFTYLHLPGFQDTATQVGMRPQDRPHALR